jgi:hypothetical protein
MAVYCIINELLTDEHFKELKETFCESQRDVMVLSHYKKIVLKLDNPHMYDHLSSYYGLRQFQYGYTFDTPLFEPLQKKHIKEFLIGFLSNDVNVRNECLEVIVNLLDSVVFLSEYSNFTDSRFTDMEIQLQRGGLLL